MAVVTDKAEKLKQIKAFHQETLNALGIPNVKVISKMAFPPIGLFERHVGFFESEISKGEDIYLEFGSKELTPELIPGYQLRDLLKWRFNPNFREEYPTSEPDPVSGHRRFFVPIAELTVVKPEQKMLKTKNTNPEVKKESKEEAFNNESDPFTREMTIKDYAAIHMRKPCSNKSWLNDLITKWNP